MFCLSRHLKRKYSPFLWYYAAIITVFGLISTASQTYAAEQNLPLLHVYTEVRDRSQLVTDAQGRTWVDNSMSRLVEVVLAEAGVEFQSSVVPWSRMLNSLSNQPNTLAYPLLRIPEREDQFAWVGHLQHIDSYLFGLRSRIDELPDSLDEVGGFRLGTMRGDAFHNFFVAQGYPNLVVFNNSTPWLSMLQRGRIDLMPFALTGIAGYLERSGEPPDTLAPVIRLDALSYPLYFVMNLNSDPELVKKIADAYQRVVSDGRFEEIQGFSHPGL